MHNSFTFFSADHALRAEQIYPLPESSKSSHGSSSSIDIAQERKKEKKHKEKQKRKIKRKTIIVQKPTEKDNPERHRGPARAEQEKTREEGKFEWDLIQTTSAGEQ